MNLLTDAAGLATCRYDNMDQFVAQALALYARLSGKQQRAAV